MSSSFGGGRLFRLDRKENFVVCQISSHRNSLFRGRDRWRISVRSGCMASPTPSAQTSAGEVVLGLVIERPDTGYRVAQRMKERLGSTQFADQTVSRALKRLQQQGLVGMVDGEYVATPRGTEHFREWLCASIPLPPVREELHARIALCRPEDLPRLAGIVRDAELACTVTVRDLNRRVREERRAVESVRDWRQRACVIVMGGDLAWWEARIKWLENLRGELEAEWRRFQSERQSVAAPRA
jgi:DNA-binding PadR family transcriptional regulator